MLFIIYISYFITILEGTCSGPVVEVRGPRASPRPMQVSWIWAIRAPRTFLSCMLNIPSYIPGWSVEFMRNAAVEMQIINPSGDPSSVFSCLAITSWSNQLSQLIWPPSVPWVDHSLGEEIFPNISGDNLLCDLQIISSYPIIPTQKIFPLEWQTISLKLWTSQPYQTCSFFLWDSIFPKPLIPQSRDNFSEWWTLAELYWHHPFLCILSCRCAVHTQKVIWPSSCRDELRFQSFYYYLYKTQQWSGC